MKRDKKLSKQSSKQASTRVTEKVDKKNNTEMSHWNNLKKKFSISTTALSYCCCFYWMWFRYDDDDEEVDDKVFCMAHFWMPSQTLEQNERNNILRFIRKLRGG